MSNFQTNQKQYSEYAKLATSAESLIYSDARSSLTVFGTFAEQLTKQIFHLDGLVDWELNQKQRIEKMSISTNEYPATILNALNILRINRNKATHNPDFAATSEIALDVDQKAYLIWNWFLQVYSLDTVAAYEVPKNTNETLKNQQKQIELLQEKIRQLQLAQRQTPQKITSQEHDRRHEINVQFAKQHKLTEDETRQLIDKQLRDAGWKVDSHKLNNWQHHTIPLKGHNMAIAEWVLSNGMRADYALFDSDKRFLGIVEAKKWDQDISGQMAQPKNYAKLVDITSTEYQLVSNNLGEFKVPFIYTTNGRPYLKQFKEKSGIWFWDARNPLQPSFALESFHSPEDLKLKLTATNPGQANQNLVDDNDFPKFADRYYQIAAIKNIEAAIKTGHKRILLAMATGTGKTRTAISLMYRLLKHKRARRILYLVDRNSLGRQTVNAIKDNKVNSLPIASIYGLKELQDKNPDLTTKIQIATVQGMIKRLFFNDNEQDKPSVGQYDFIIVDEAHRGYAEDRELSSDEYHFYDQDDYVSQYRRVIDYFDATAIAMTATPALQTTQIFGNPVYSYSYQQAVLDNYLVDHDTPQIIKTKLSTSGIKFKRGQEVSLFDLDDQTIHHEQMPDDMKFDVAAFNKKVITESFNKVVCDQLAQKYLDPNDEKLGKTLIFAATDSHADMIVRLLKQSFQDANNPVNDNAIEKITGSLRNPNQEINNFKNEKYPNIVVTVDLLTTGIDVPEITNLVFLRRIKSRILYEQMLGRATRLCPEIHKDIFRIYDAVGIYEAMDKVNSMKPVVKNALHNVHYFIEHKHDFFEVNEDSKQYQVDMAAAIDRKIKRLDDKKRNKFKQLTQISSVEDWARNLSHLNKAGFLMQWQNFERLDQIKINQAKQYIFDEPDEYLETVSGYGTGNQKPDDYIDSFNKFVKDNIDLIPALQVIATKPKDLTYSELKNIKSKLEQNGFKEKDLQHAWKSAKHVQTTADIISFIRQAANGSQLVDHNVRIHNAMQKVYGMADWNIEQRKWLKKIENQLAVTTVLGPSAEQAFDENNYFKRQGGYKRIKQVFPENVNKIIVVLNEALYA